MRRLIALAVVSAMVAGATKATAASSGRPITPSAESGALRSLASLGAFDVGERSDSRLAITFSFEGLLGANVLHGAYWLPDRAAALSLFEQARAMNLRLLRIPIPMSLVVNRTRYTEDSLVANLREVMGVARAKGLRVILVMDGYTPYAGSCGYKVGFVEVAAIARRIVKEFKNHPALFAWDLLNEPLSGADGMGCPKSNHPSIVKAVEAMHWLIRAQDARTPHTVGEAYPEYQSTWNHVVDFASPHLYFPHVQSPVTEEQLERLRRELRIHLSRLQIQVGNIPLVIGEFGFDPLSQVNDADQARAFHAYYDVLRERNIGSLFWQLAFNDYTVLREDGSWRPAAHVVKRQAAANGMAFVRQTPPPAGMRPGEAASVSVTVRNTGRVPWTEESLAPYRLGAQAPHDTTQWMSLERAPKDNRALIEGFVQPGEETTFRWTITAPRERGLYRFQWRMVQEGVEWFGERTPEALVYVDDRAAAGPAALGVEAWQCQANAHWHSDGRCYAAQETCNPAGRRWDEAACTPGDWKESPCACP